MRRIPVLCIQKIEMMSDVQSDAVIYICKSLFPSFCLEQHLFLAYQDQCLIKPAEMLVGDVVIRIHHEHGDPEMRIFSSW